MTLLRLRLFVVRLWDAIALTDCACCRRVLFRKHAKAAQHLVAGWVDLCPECYERLYGESKK